MQGRGLDDFFLVLGTKPTNRYRLQMEKKRIAQTSHLARVRLKTMRLLQLLITNQISASELIFHSATLGLIATSWPSTSMKDHSDG